MWDSQARLWTRALSLSFIRVAPSNSAAVLDARPVGARSLRVAVAFVLAVLLLVFF
jgi:hypothetical protein